MAHYVLRLRQSLGFAPMMGLCLGAVGATVGCKAAVSRLKDSFSQNVNTVTPPLGRSYKIGLGFDTGAEGGPAPQKFCWATEIPGGAAQGDQYFQPGGPAAGGAPTPAPASVSTATPTAPTTVAAGAGLVDPAPGPSDPASVFTDLTGDVDATGSEVVDAVTNGVTVPFADLPATLRVDLNAQLDAQGGTALVSGSSLSSIGQTQLASLTNASAPAPSDDLGQGSASLDDTTDACGSEETCISFKLYNSTQSAASSLSGDIKAKYVSMFATAEGGVNAASTSTSSGKAQYLVGRVRFIRSSVEAPQSYEYRLSEQATALAQEPDLGDFRSLCGNSFIASRIDGAEMYVFATITGSQAGNGQTEGVSASGGSSGPVKLIAGTLTGSAKIDAMKNQANALVATDVRAVARGGVLPTGTVPSDLYGILDIMKSFLPVAGSNMRIVPLAYTLEGYEKMPGTVNGKPVFLKTLVPAKGSGGKLFPPVVPAPTAAATSTSTAAATAAAATSETTPVAPPACQAQRVSLKQDRSGLTLMTFGNALAACTDLSPRMIVNECIPSFQDKILSAINSVGGGVTSNTCVWSFSPHLDASGSLDAAHPKTYWQPATDGSSSFGGWIDGPSAKCYVACTN